MDNILKTDVDEQQIKPYMADIKRQFEYIDKEDIIKKIVTATVGRFLQYYKNAPQIEKPSSSHRKDSDNKTNRDQRKTEEGYARLFINLGKVDGFYPAEIMQFINRNIHGHQEVGHIDILPKQTYFEVPKQDLRKVARALDGTYYRGRKVRCNDADDKSRPQSRGKQETIKGRYTKKQTDQPSQYKFKKNDWEELLTNQ